MVKDICEAGQINHQVLYSNLKALIKMYDNDPNRFSKTFGLKE